MDVHRSFIYNTLKLEAIQIYFGGWTVKLIVVHLYHGILVSDKKGQTVDFHNDLNIMTWIYAEWNKQISKGYMVYFSIFITLVIKIF